MIVCGTLCITMRVSSGTEYPGFLYELSTVTVRRNPYLWSSGFGKAKEVSPQNYKWFPVIPEIKKFLFITFFHQSITVCNRALANITSVFRYFWCSDVYGSMFSLRSFSLEEGQLFFVGVNFCESEIKTPGGEKLSIHPLSVLSFQYAMCFSCSAQVSADSWHVSVLRDL